MTRSLKGVFAASLSIISDSNELDIESTIEHAKNIDKHGVGPCFLGSTSQAQLISIKEKKDLIKEISRHKFKNEVLLGTGCNSLKENINLMLYAIGLGINIFLIGNPAYYKNDDEGVYNFYANIITEAPDCKIIIYNFNKLMGYTFSADVVNRLVSKYPDNIVGMKDSSGNLWNNLKVSNPNFSMFVGSENKLLKGLELGCSGCISAVTNVTYSLARQVYDDFHKKKKQTVNEKLCAVRKAFDETGSLISALHSFMSDKDMRYKKILPPLTLLPEEKKQELLVKLKDLNFVHSKNIAA